MPSPSGDQRAIITSLFTDLPNKFAMYSPQASNSNSYAADSRQLDTQIHDLNFQIQELDRQEQTYDREFLDRKKNPPKRGFFYGLGLRTTEDWVLTYFFFSYIMFVIVLLVNVLMYSTKKIVAAALVFGVGLLVGFLSLLLIYRYA
jgi:Flp pilus assembly protein TadB